VAQITLVAGTPQQILLAPGTPITIGSNPIALGLTSAGANAYATAPQMAAGNTTWPGIYINYGTESYWVGVAAATGNATISYPS
jgi:hypothetical protein